MTDERISVALLLSRLHAMRRAVKQLNVNNNMYIVQHIHRPVALLI